MGKVHKVAGLKISRVRPTTTHHKSLPTLAPPEERLRDLRSHIVSANATALTHTSKMEDVFDREQRQEQHDTVARLTVYAMNLTVMVFALPIGLALLFLNILGGENLRTTAHVMALTGLFSALTMANGGLLWVPV